MNDPYNGNGRKSPEDDLGRSIEKEVKETIGTVAAALQDAAREVSTSLRDNESVQRTVKDLGAAARDGVQGIQSAIAQAQKNAEKEKRRRKRRDYAKKANGALSEAGGLMLPAGILAACAFSAFEPGDPAGALILGFISLWFFAGAFGAFLKSRTLRRIATYQSVLGERSYCTLQELSELTGKSQGAVRKDLFRLISSGKYEDVYLAPDGTRLFSGETAYRLYLAQRQAQQEAGARRQPARPEPAGVLAECRAFLSDLREQQRLISDAPVLEQVQRIEEQTVQIIAWLEKHPGGESQIRRFVSYYMPTTLKLLRTYNEVDPQCCCRGNTDGYLRYPVHHQHRVPEPAGQPAEGYRDGRFRRDLGAGNSAGPGGPDQRRAARPVGRGRRERWSLGAFVFIIILLLVIVPRMRQESVRRTPYGKEHRGTQYGYRAAGKGGAQVQPAQYSYPAGAQAQGAAGTGGAPNPDAPGRQSNDTLRGKQLLGMCAGIAGGAWAALMGVAALGGVSEVIWCISNGFSFGDELMLVVIPALLAAGGWKAAQAGFALMNRIKRFRLYDAIIGERRVCPVSDIARASGRKPEEVERDLLDMVRRGYFPLGFVDAETACFYADNAAWRAQNPERARQQDAPLGKEQPRPAPAAQEPVPEDEPGGGYLRELERQLARIENADIRAKAARLREHTEDIFAWVKLHPECADDARRFCSYYLPTAVKLLNTYNEVAPHADESSVAAGIQSEVSQVLDTMSTAFRGLMDNLLQNTAVDMQAEISALETVLAQEGLAQNGFTM